MRVLLVTHYALPHIGGIEILADLEARLLVERGHDVVLLTSLARPDVSAIDPAGVKVCRVSAWNYLERQLQVPWPVFSPALLVEAYRYVKWCDLVHVHGFLYLGSVVSLIIARLLGKPTILTEHIGAAWYPRGLRRLVQRVAIETVGRLSVRLADKSYGHHEKIVALLRKLSGRRGRVTYLRNPIDRGLFRPPSSAEREKARRDLGWSLRRRIVLFVGRMISRKGIDLLLSAKELTYDLVFCGSGRLESLAPHIGEGVIVLPPRPQVELVQLYHAVDVLAVPSRAEGGLMLVAQEALACGLPVVVGEDAGLRDYQLCPGLFFCELSVDGVRRAVADALRVSEAGSNEPAQRVAFDRFFPEASEWLDELCGRSVNRA